MPKQPTSSHTVLLGIDYGTKRIGLSIGQMITQTAQAIPLITCKNNLPDWRQITQVISEWGVDGIVVGLPLNMDGSPQPITELTHEFITKLKQHTTLPIYTVDERLTTIEAKQQLSQRARKPHQLDRQKIDSYAAKIILEAWLKQL